MKPPKGCKKIKKIRKANKASRKILRDAEIKAEHIIKNAQLDGKQAIFEMKQEADKERGGTVTGTDRQF